MSEPKLISPMLDGFLMGSPMSDHNGVQCCPAMKENSDYKYIVKIISVPASQTQLDALLLTGAYQNPAEAMDYFKEQSDSIVAEAEFLQEMAKLDGFLAYEAWQIVPMEKNQLGYEIYLLGSYKRSLEKHMRRTMMTHLEAINMGLDLCSALATVRRAGYLYLDLKPTNIFLSEKKSYRIGDLGFAKIEEFPFTSLPGKYISRYAAPELQDPMNTLNDTADTYSLGMILYQIYNDGNLPAEPDRPEDSYPNPVNADYELAEIIMKAIAPKVEDRWKDPTEMGQALVAYMQRNDVNDTPITPHSTVISDPQDIVKPQETAELQEDPELTAEVEEAPADETVPTAEDAPLLENIPVTDEVSAIIAHADDLISHEVPEGVTAPEAPEEIDPFKNFDPDGELYDRDIEDEEDHKDSDILLQEQEYRNAARKESRKALRKTAVGILIALIILGILAFGCYYYYQNVYLLPIEDLKIEGSQDELTVYVTADIPNALTAVCIDNYGNSSSQPIVDGQATFSDLKAESLYKIQLQVEGLHKLTGKTDEIFTTDAQTEIVSFSAIAGSEDGSVLLNFTIDGPEPNEWVLIYTAEGKEEQREVFSGHSVIIKGLTVGTTYTFRLETWDDTFVTGEYQTIEYTASKVILAQDLTITAGPDSSLVVDWIGPDGIDVENWTVRCYDDEDYEQFLTVTETRAVFENVDISKSYSVEVTAAGMTQPERASITANPITITGFHIEETEGEEHSQSLEISWDYEGLEPAGGWILMYSIDNSETQSAVNCPEANAKITPNIPGAVYHFHVQAADGISIFDNTHDYTSADPDTFDQNSMDASKVTANLVKTPDDEQWSADSVSSDDYTQTFRKRDSISVILRCSQNFYLPDEGINIMYVIRDGEGNVLPKLTATESVNWKVLWSGGDYHATELTLPAAPADPGEYSITIYFNGDFVAKAPFTIAE